MSRLKTWTQIELDRLKELVLSQKFTYIEIAELMGRSKSECAQRAQYMGLKNPTYLKRHTKHAHLREKLLKYYLNHSAEEVQKHFNLTPSEFKSCLIYAYKDPKLTHLRKETRRHDQWSIDETKFLLQHAGLNSREWISRKLNRGGMHSVKESLSRLNIHSKYINGLPKKMAFDLLRVDHLPKPVKTKAGPTGCRGCFQFQIIAWVQLEQFMKHKKIDPEIKIAIRAMAKFQKWIFGTENPDVILKKIHRFVKES